MSVADLCRSCGVVLPADAGSQCDDCESRGTVDEAPVTLIGVASTEDDGTEDGEQLLAMPATGSQPKRIGEYDLLGELAAGGMGVVYRARHRTLRRDAAVKMILGGRFTGTAARQRFTIEAEAAARRNHPAIISIYEIGEVEGQMFFAMKFVEGGSLADRLEQGPIPTREAMTLLAQVARGIAHAHARGVLHRDLKPANILLGEEGQPLLTDFGLAKSTTADSGVTATGAVLGTPAYMPPEQASGEGDVTTRADVYGLGAILYELLTGQPPHSGPSLPRILHSVLNEVPLPPRERDASVDADLDLICCKAIARNPADRYDTVADLADDLDAWLAGEPISVQPPTLRAAIVRWARRNRGAVLVTAAVAVMMLAMGPLLASALIDDVSKFAVYDRFPEAERPWVTGVVRLASLQNEIALSLLATTLLWPAIGYAIAVAARPSSRWAALRLGTVVGGTLTLLLPLTAGWMLNAINVAELDSKTIEQLARIVWADSAGQADWRRNELESAYPGLADVPLDERSSVFAARSYTDAVAGVPIRLLVFSIFEIAWMVPVTLGVVLAYELRQRKQPGWITALRYAIAWLATTTATAAGATVAFQIVTSEFAARDLLPIGATLVVSAVILWLTLRRWRRGEATA